MGKRIVYVTFGWGVVIKGLDKLFELVKGWFRGDVYVVVRRIEC